ncbi:MAG: DUF4442 domain-containing protein [Bacteroidia bacterium]
MSKSIYKTERKENFKSKLIKLGFNLFPAYRGTGAFVTFISDDWKEIHIKLGLTWRTRNYVGTVFGGSTYGALDPMYMIQLINILGADYVVWDMAANIKFIKPIKKKVYARFLITDELIESIRQKISLDKKYVVNLPISFQDKDGVVYAEVEKVIYIADKEYYKNKNK